MYQQNNPFVADAIAYSHNHQDELITLIQTLCTIPSPSHHEEQRAAFIQSWLLDHGCKGTYIDEVNNVIYPYLKHTRVVHHSHEAKELMDEKQSPMVAFLAHIDTVFPDLIPFEVRREGNRLYCPGIGDDTTNVAVLMLMARYITLNQLPVEQDLLFVFDSCEEGLGNLLGCKTLFEAYGERIVQMIAFDGTYEGICHEAVGSLRYEVEVKTEGGHSYSNFGNRNAITCLAQLIDDLYAIKVQPGTTYNVGGIGGGTSINTIAQEAKMLYEIRSNDREQMDCVRIYFDKMVDAHRAKDIEINVTLLGERPCMGDVNAMIEQELVERASEIIQRHAGRSPVLYAGSTDCNIPFSRGISAVCFGAYLGKGAHTKEEYIEVDSLLTGFAIVAEFMMHYVTH